MAKSRSFVQISSDRKSKENTCPIAYLGGSPLTLIGMPPNKSGTQVLDSQSKSDPCKLPLSGEYHQMFIRTVLGTCPPTPTMVGELSILQGDPFGLWTYAMIRKFFTNPPP